MKNKWFYPGLFWESVRQLRVIGIVFCGILMVSTLLSGAFYLLMSLSELAAYRYVDPTITTVSRSLLGADEILSMLPLVAFGVTPVFTYILFNFQNKRNMSDFYHALPCTRQAMFTSRLAAVAFYITGMIWLYAAASIGVMLCLSHFYAINIFAILVMTFNCWAAAMLVMSGTALAMSMTGTIFTNVVGTLLVLFGPRILLLFVTLMITLPTVSQNHLLGVFDPSYNLVSNYFMSFLSTPALVDYLPGGLYTLFLSVVYAGLALWAFSCRRSEGAGRSAGSYVTQTVFRLSITTLVCLIPCGIFITIIREGLDPFALFGVASLYIVALNVYFLYELITTRKPRNLLKAMPMLGVLAAINITLVAGPFVVEQVILSRDIDPSEVASISLVQDGRYWSDDSIWNENQYFSEKEATVVHTDKETIALLANSFTENNKLLRESRKKYDAMVNTGNVTRRMVRFQMKDGSELCRYVYLYPQEQTALFERILADPNLRDVYMKLPALDGVGNTCSVDGLNQKQSNELYATLREELQTVDFETWYRYINNEMSDDSLDASVWLTYTLGLRNTETNIYLPDFLPRTYGKYLELYHQNNPKMAQDLATAFRNFATKYQNHTLNYNDDYFSTADLTVTPLLTETEEKTYSLYLMEDDQGDAFEDVDEIMDLIDRLTQTPATTEQPLYKLELSVDDNDNYVYYVAYVAMPEGVVDPLLKSDVETWR